MANNREEADLKRLQQELEKLRLAYAHTFSGPNSDLVMADLMQFCRGKETTFHENRSVSDMLDGRREVFLRIEEFTELSPDDLWLRRK